MVRSALNPPDALARERRRYFLQIEYPSRQPRAYAPSASKRDGSRFNGAATLAQPSA